MAAFIAVRCIQLVLAGAAMLELSVGGAQGAALPAFAGATFLQVYQKRVMIEVAIQ